jgi:hypothetical protein
MTSTTKQNIAREWLIFLACIALGLMGTYFFYERFNGYGNSYERPYRHYANLGDFLNDLWPPIRTVYSGSSAAPFPPPSAVTGTPHLVWDGQVLSTWLVICSPYLFLLFGRSIFWSVNTLRQR